MRLFRLCLVFIQISLSTAGPDHFLFNWEIECKIQKEWHFDMVFRESVQWPQDSDYIGERKKSSTTHSKIIFETQGTMTDDAGGHYEPYLEIYHTCHHDNQKRLLKAFLPAVPIHKGWYHFTFSLDVTNRAGEIPYVDALYTYDQWGRSGRFLRLLLN